MPTWPASNLKSTLTDRHRPSKIPSAHPHTSPQSMASGFSPCQVLCGDEGGTQRAEDGVESPWFSEKIIPPAVKDQMGCLAWMVLSIGLL